MYILFAVTNAIINIMKNPSTLKIIFISYLNASVIAAFNINLIEFYIEEVWNFS